MYAAGLAATLVVAVGAAPRFSHQAPDAVDAQKLAAVQRIRARIEERTSKASGPAAAYTVTIPNTTVSYAMVPVPAGEFLMGSAGPGARTQETPQHKVRVDAFWMQAHEVTWDQFIMFMFADQAHEVGHPDALVDGLSRPTSPHVDMSFGRGSGGFPAISMTQNAANRFAQWLSAKTGQYYRLPTEAEWEYACRAGATAPLAAAQLDDYAWYGQNAGTKEFPDGTYHKGGGKKPNAWGLYDMLGNVMEWTLDQFAPYPAEPQVNPWVSSKTAYPHAVRGGSWGNDATGVSCTVRVGSDADWKRQDPQLPKSVWYMTDAQWLGFRLVRPATLPAAEVMYRAWNNGVEFDPY